MVRNAKRYRSAQGKVSLLANRQGTIARKAALQKRLYYHQLLRHYNELGERIGARTDVCATVTQASDGKYTLDASQLDDDELMTDLLDMRATKEAIRELASDLGINWLAGPDTEMPTEEVLRLVGQHFEGQHRTGRQS